MVSHLTFSDKLDALYSDFTPGEVRTGSDGSYRAEIVMTSAAWIIKHNCETQYIQGGGVVPSKQ